jgi:RimJ/RimL family protein N-acetyltransferase
MSKAIADDSPAYLKPEFDLYLKESSLISPDIKRDSLPVEIWQPSLFRLKPRGAQLSLSWWWFYHFTDVLRNRPRYWIFLIREDKAIIHHAVASTKVFKFPFMEEQDIHIGPILTDPECTGRGLATSAGASLIEFLAKDNRNFWAMVDPENKAEIKVFEKLGFVNCGVVKREKRFLFSVYSYDK